jgi:hypothetical protein
LRGHLLIRMILGLLVGILVLHGGPRSGED